jgi:hypothetical protein
MPENRRMGRTAKHTVTLVAAVPAKAGATAKPRARKGKWRDHAAALEAYVRPKANAAINAPDLTDLPPELLKELRFGSVDALEAQIIAVFRALGGAADLDQILIGLFRRFNVIQKRRFLQNKIWRMIRKGHIHKVKGMRGQFCIAAEKKPKRARK